MASSAAVAPCGAAEVLFLGTMGVFGPAAASRALRDVAGWRQATCTGQIQTLCGIHGA